MGPHPIIPANLFLEFRQSAIEELEFSFNNIIYAQIDGVSMGSPQGPVLANIFVGFHESLLFERHCKPHVYVI